MLFYCRLSKKIERHTFIMTQFARLILCSFIYSIVGEIFGHPLRDLARTAAIVEQPLSNGMVLMRRRVTAGEAMYFCETRKKGRLAALINEDDADALINAIKDISTPWTNAEGEKQLEFGMSRRYWIGLTDMVMEGEWVWVNQGSVLGYEDKWTKGEPDHLMDNTGGRDFSEHCVSLWNPTVDTGTTHTFNDENCMNKHYFICEVNVPK